MITDYKSKRKLKQEVSSEEVDLLYKQETEEYLVLSFHKTEPDKVFSDLTSARTR